MTTYSSLEELSNTDQTSPSATSPAERPATFFASGRGIVASTPISGRLKDSIVAVLDASGRIVGTGFIVDKRIALTCSHVILAAGSAPGNAVCLRFEIDHSEIQARVDPKAGSPREKDDVAVLRLDQDPPPGAAPLEIKSPENSSGHAFHTFGYPRLGTVVGLGDRGTIIETLGTIDGRRLLQLSSPIIGEGFSGAPIWDQELLKVVGMIRSPLTPLPTGRLGDFTLAVPGDVLIGILPKLSKQTTQALTNPFYAGGAVPPELFVGRQNTLSQIQAGLSGQALQNYSIVAERRMGKSSLLRYICEQAANDFPQPTIVICLDLLQGYARTRKDLLRALREKLTTPLGRQLWDKSLDGDLGEFSRAIETLSQAGIRLVLCLDEIEKLAKNEAEFGDLFDALRSAANGKPFAMLVTSSRPLSKLRKQHGSTSPFYNIFVQETLGLLRDDEWRAMLFDRMPTITPKEIDAIGRLTGGHPFFTQLAARRLWEARFAKGDPDWQSCALDDITPHWEGWWKHLKPEEQDTVRLTLLQPAAAPYSNMVRDLHKRGLLRGGSPFSAEFAAWVSGQ